MVTIREVMDECKRVRFSVKHFGSTNVWRNRFDTLVTQVGKAIASDISYSTELVDLSPNVELGPMGELAYLNLRMFLKNNQISAPSHLL
jgi:hypothetical protein